MVSVRDPATYHVNPSDGRNGRGGRSRRDPFADVERAIDVAKAHDTIVLAPGTYEENFVVPTGKDYLTIRGEVDAPYGWPDITPASGIAIAVHAQGVRLKNLRAVSAAAATPAVQIQGNGYRISDMRCEASNATGDGMLLLPDLDDDSYSASEGYIQRVQFRNCGRYGLVFKNPGVGVEGGVGPTDVVVDDCDFINIGTSDIFDVDTEGSDDTTWLRGRISRCRFLDVGASRVYINLSAGGNNTGMICDCHFADVAMIADQIVAPAAVVMVGCYDAAGLINASAF